MPKLKLFPGQENNEKIVMLLRRHPVNFFKNFLFYTCLSFLPLLINYFLKNFSTLELSGALLLNLKMLLCLYYLFIITFFYRAWIDHYLDIWVITSERIVDIEQKGLFSRKISMQKLYRIQDVSTEVKGLIPTFLNYGNVYIQTAGAHQNFIFKKIHNPDKVSKKLIKLVNWSKKYEEE